MKKLLQISILLILGIGLFSACDDDDKKVKEYQLTVASAKRIMFIADHFDPYYAKYNEKNEWNSFPYIDGFEHRERTEYVIRVKEEYDKSMEGMIGGSPYSYHLLDIVSSTEKDSEDIPLQEGYIWVASKKTGDPDLPYYINDIMTGGWKKWADIEGFDSYEEGYQYSLVISCKYNGANVPQKYTYTYKKTSRKEKVETEGLPK